MINFNMKWQELRELLISKNKSLLTIQEKLNTYTTHEYASYNHIKVQLDKDSYFKIIPYGRFKAKWKNCVKATQNNVFPMKVMKRRYTGLINDIRKLDYLKEHFAVHIGTKILKYMERIERELNALEENWEREHVRIAKLLKRYAVEVDTWFETDADISFCSGNSVVFDDLDYAQLNGLLMLLPAVDEE